VLAEAVAQPDTSADADDRWMRRALQLAQRGIGRTSPNPVVGACIVSDAGVVLGQGAHERAGEPHAEVHALDEAGEDARGATMYCTLEPCAHVGRTGPCVDRIIAAGIRRVVAAMEDPYPLVNGRGFEKLREHGIGVEVGTGRAAATRLNQPFLTTVRFSRPFVILKAATSLDGHIAAARGTRTAITSPHARRHAQFVRARVDAVAVGSATILVDDPLLTVRDVFRERPLTRVVFDRRLRTPLDARLLQTVDAGPVIIVTSPDAISADAERAQRLRDAGATLLPIVQSGIATALRELAAFEIQSVLLEGGSAVHAAAWDEGVVDFVQMYVSPAPLGAGGVPLLEGRPFSSAALHDRRVELLGPDVLIEGYVHRLD
jgi:diaminohydroxyphosphoribosylaminopyrimidine deaminase / 5-amino-6-(5-phosphoribosylamino)uracil reductase